MEPPYTDYLARWSLRCDGDPIHTHSSDLLPVRTRAGVPAMLKLPHEEHEKRGALLMRWWEGSGAAGVLASDGSGALLLERATGARSLARMAHAGEDDAATRVLCEVAARLHAPRADKWPAGLLPLETWFRELAPAAAAYGGVLARASAIAGRLLAQPRDEVALHGDLHHDNVLDFGGVRGWLAIDPKSLLGERGFDYANIFTNPQPPGIASSEIALHPGVFERRLAIVGDAARIEPRRLLQWIAAYCGLSAAWIIGDGDDASLDLAILQRALSLLS